MSVPVYVNAYIPKGEQREKLTKKQKLLEYSCEIGLKVEGRMKLWSSS